MSIDVTLAATASLSERVAEEIRVLLTRRKLRQSNLARELNVSEQWVSVRLRGVQPIDLNDLQRIAAALGVDPAALLPSGGSQITAQYVAKPQARPHAVDVRSPRSGMSGSAGSRSRRSRRLVDQMAA